MDERITVNAIDLSNHSVAERENSRSLCDRLYLPVCQRSIPASRVLANKGGN